MSHGSKRWVVVVLIYADFRKNVVAFDEDTASDLTRQMKRTLNSLFEDLLSTAMDPMRSRMFVIMNSIDYHDSDSDRTTAGTLLFKVGNPDRLHHNRIIESVVIDRDRGTQAAPDPENAVQTPQLLQRILTEYVRVRQDEEVLFLTWDHGSSFGIFREVDHGFSAVRNPLGHDLNDYPYLAHFWNTVHAQERDGDRTTLTEMYGLSDGCERRGPQAAETITAETGCQALPVSANVREILTNAELGRVLTCWLNPEADAENQRDAKKVAVLLMMNCWMMNFHTMFALKDAVECLVAPQGAIDTPGYNYKAVLSFLSDEKRGDISARDLAVKCVTTMDCTQMRKRSEDLRADRRDMSDHWKVFAVDLQSRRDDNELVIDSNIRALESVAGTLTDAIRTDGQPLTDFFTAARMVSHDFTKASALEKPGFMVDIVNWLELLHGLSSFNAPYQPFPVIERSSILYEIFELIKEFRRNPLILAETSGSKIYSNSYSVAGRPTGYSLFFPDSYSNDQNLIDNVRKDQLLRMLPNWEKFLKTVYPGIVWRAFFD